MARIELQRLKIELNGPLMLPVPQVEIAEVAPAIRQMRRDPQRRLIIDTRRLEVAGASGGVAELGVQVGHRLGGFGSSLLRLSEASLESRDGFHSLSIAE